VLVFQTPLVVVGLVWLGVMSSHTLRRTGGWVIS
jgi:Sec-independent protein secretion pathway component TatC